MAIKINAAVPTLVVTDIKKAKAFYGEKLGLEEVGDAPSVGPDCTYRVGDHGYLYVYERAAPSGSTATSCGLQVDDVEETVKYLRGRGVRFEEYDIPEMGLKTVDGIATQNGVKSAFFTDPFGNILAIDDALAVMTDRLRQRPGQRPSPEGGLHA